MFELIWKPKCTHEKITADMKSGYCTDCGEYVENHWYISRCGCCGFKHQALLKNGQIINSTKFCKNCGSRVFVTQEIDDLDIVSVNYAVFRKQTRAPRKQDAVQTWMEQSMPLQMKLLPGC